MDVTLGDQRPLAIDLFAGAGGLSFGFATAGFALAQAVEQQAHAGSTYRANHRGVDLIEADIQELDPRTCLERVGLRVGDVSVLIGGPPCQGFSESNRRTRSSDNRRNHLYVAFLRFAEVVRPQWVVIENVAGLKTMERGIILDRILEGLRQQGYVADSRELNAVDYGVPQVRRRLFILANRVGVRIPHIVATHGKGLKPQVTVREAISDLPVLENGAGIDELPYGSSTGLADYQHTMRAGCSGATVSGNLVSRNAEYVLERYKHIPEGGNWQSIPEELLSNYADRTRCHTGIYHRLAWDLPAKVIGNFRKNMLIHPGQDRGLSVREAARLQGFPDSFAFSGSIGFQQQQVADAVPPLLAKVVATCVMQALGTVLPGRALRF